MNKEVTKKMVKLADDVYNLSVIFREFCKSEENLYSEDCRHLLTLAEYMCEISDELWYELNNNED